MFARVHRRFQFGLGGLLCAMIWSCNSGNEVVDAGQGVNEVEAASTGGANDEKSSGGSVAFDVPVRKDEDKTFIDYCLEESSDESLNKTLKTLLDLVDEKLCGVAQAKLDRLERISFLSAGITDIRPLRKLASLESLILDYNAIKDLSVVGTIKNLKSLSLVKTPVTDLTPLTNLPKLRELNLTATEITSFSSLSGLENLRSLILAATEISDLSGIEQFTSLESLNFANTAIDNVSALSSIVTLQDLNISGTDVADFSPLASLSALVILDARSTPLELDPSLKTQTNCPETMAPPAVVQFCQLIQPSPEN